jgi:hypothetical protein
MRRILMFVAGLTVLALAASAEAHVVRYMSQHPLPRKMGGGFCYIDVAHVHDFGPSDPRMYRQIDGQYYFVGDPSPFSYEGPRTAYVGPHPIVEANVHFGQPEYCYLQGPHYHWYAPPAQASFEMRGGAYWYVGAYEPVYYEQRPRYVVVNEAYAPIVYTRPVVDVTVAPPGFHGEIVAAGPGWRAQAVVGAPPPPPPVVQVGVGINLGGPPPPTVIYEERPHDNGRHRGWEHERGGWRGAPPPGHAEWRQGPPPGPQAHPQPTWRSSPGPQAQPAGWRSQPAAHAQPTGWRSQPAPQAQRGGGNHVGGNHGHGWKR